MNRLKKPVSQAMVKRQYVRDLSFADLLPIAEWDDETKTALLEDGQSLGALLELRDIATEACPEAQIKQLHDKVMRVLSRMEQINQCNTTDEQVKFLRNVFVIRDILLMIFLGKASCEKPSLYLWTCGKVFIKDKRVRFDFKLVKTNRKLIVMVLAYFMRV